MNGTLARSCGIALGLLVAACGAPTSRPSAEPPPTVTRSPTAEDEAPSPEPTATVPPAPPTPPPRLYPHRVGRGLASLGREDIPLGAGQAAPLAGTDEFPEGLRESANGFWGLLLPTARQVYPPTR